MRATLLAVLAASTFVSAAPLLALEANSTMASWQAATADEKLELVTELLKREGRENATVRVLKCLDAAASAPGHADLPIRQVLKACEKAGSEPV